MVRNASFHRRRDPQIMMNSAKVVIHKVERDWVLRVFESPGKKAKEHLVSHEAEVAEIFRREKATAGRDYADIKVPAPGVRP